MNKRIMWRIAAVQAACLLGLFAASGAVLAGSHTSSPAGISTSPGGGYRNESPHAPPPSTPWQPAASLESIAGTNPELNTAAAEGCPILSRKGAQLYLASNRPGGLGELDIWVAESSGAPGVSGEPPVFGAPANLGAPINSAANDFCPSPLPDGQGFMFVSNRPGGCGGSDIYITRHHPQKGWEAPANLGCEVNSAADEAGPVLLLAEAGPPVLYFSSARPGGPGGINLYRSQKGRGWMFAAAELVPGVNSDADDQQPYVRSDGRELVFASNRPGSQGFDIWSATRHSTRDGWSAPANLGTHVNSEANETRPSLSWDGKLLLFGSNRPGAEGASDIYYSTRN